MFLLRSQMKSYQSGREDACLANECDPRCLYVFLWRKQWLDVACPDHQSHHVKFGVPFVTLAALLSQSVSGYEPFWATEMWNDWNPWPTYCEYNGAGSYYLREINMIKWMNELNKNGNSDWGYSWITAYSLHACLKFQKCKSYIQTLSGLQSVMHKVINISSHQTPKYI